MADVYEHVTPAMKEQIPEAVGDLIAGPEGSDERDRLIAAVPQMGKVLARPQTRNQAGAVTAVESKIIAQISPNLG